MLKIVLHSSNLAARAFVIAVVLSIFLSTVIIATAQEQIRPCNNVTSCKGAWAVCADNEKKDSSKKLNCDRNLANCEATGIWRGTYVVCRIVSTGATKVAAEGEAIKSANLRSARAEAKLANCSRQFRDQQVINCVSSAVRTFATDVSSCGYIAAVAPAAAPTVVAAANEFGSTTTKQAAISVLNRASSVLRGLAAQSSGEARSVYSRIDRAFQTAISVINSKS